MHPFVLWMGHTGAYTLKASMVSYLVLFLPAVYLQYQAGTLYTGHGNHPGLQHAAYVSMQLPIAGPW